MRNLHKKLQEFMEMEFACYLGKQNFIRMIKEQYYLLFERKRNVSII